MANDNLDQAIDTLVDLIKNKYSQALLDGDINVLISAFAEATTL